MVLQCILHNLFAYYNLAQPVAQNAQPTISKLELI